LESSISFFRTNGEDRQARLERPAQTHAVETSEPERAARKEAGTSQAENSRQATGITLAAADEDGDGEEFEEF
jgi:hypothetical protein